ncbi:hypothetical protein FB45DRAFT_1024181 [Roridomyces roridus]|uniref:Uncharacterized protein n=1 Tax=Roridomyces roridus TaxID=1738132 RepID=A0AAD7C5L1_9AGAR|nr:hypothetical protein FB45DRAFT_1024181 [Roridomyces roridus]
MEPKDGRSTPEALAALFPNAPRRYKPRNSELYSTGAPALSATVPLTPSAFDAPACSRPLFGPATQPSSHHWQYRHDDARQHLPPQSHPTDFPPSDDDTGNDLQDYESEPKEERCSVTPPTSPIVPTPMNTSTTTSTTTSMITKELPTTLHFKKMDMANTANKYQALQGVTTKTNGQQYTTPPAAGSRFPEMMEKFGRNMTDKNILDYEATEGNKGWVRVYCTSYDLNPRETVQRLKHVIPRLVDTPTLMVSPPMAAEELRERLPPPWHFLISSIPAESLKMEQTVAANARAIYKALKDGSLKWKKLATEEEEEAEERRFNRLITKGLAPEAKERKVRKDFRGTHNTQPRGDGRQRRASADSDDEVVPGSGGEEDVPETGGEEDVPESGDEQQFAGYNGDYSDNDISRRKKAKSKSKSTATKTTKATATKMTKVAATKTTKAAATKTAKAAASKSTTKTTKAAASKSTKAAASKSTAKPTPKSTASKPKPPTKLSAKTKPAPKPFVPTAPPIKSFFIEKYLAQVPPPKYIFKNGKHVSNRAAVDEHARWMVQERGEYERQMRRCKGGNESGSDGENDSTSGDDEREEQVVPTKQGPPTKRRHTDEEPEEQPAKKTKKTTDKCPREDSEDEGEQPVAKKVKLIVELPCPRPAWKGALQGKKGGPPGLCPHELPQLGPESE